MFAGGRPIRNTQWSGRLAYSEPLNGKHKKNILSALCGSAVNLNLNNKCLNNYGRNSRPFCQSNKNDRAKRYNKSAIQNLKWSQKNSFRGAGLTNPGWIIDGYVENP